MPTGLHEIYVRIDRLYRTGRRDEARRLFDCCLPVLAFSNQHLDLSIRFFKRLLWRQGLYVTHGCASRAWPSTPCTSASPTSSSTGPWSSPGVLPTSGVVIASGARRPLPRPLPAPRARRSTHDSGQAGTRLALRGSRPAPQGLRLPRRHEPGRAEGGPHPIDGETVYAIASSYETSLRIEEARGPRTYAISRCCWRAKRDPVDAAGGLAVLEDYQADKASSCWPIARPGRPGAVHLTPACSRVLRLGRPQPGCSLRQPQKVRKLVIKVRL